MVRDFYFFCFKFVEISALSCSWDIEEKNAGIISPKQHLHVHWVSEETNLEIADQAVDPCP